MDEELPECHEGPAAFERFDAMMTALLEVPRSLIMRRQKAYKKTVDANPNRRGPKRKTEEVEDELPLTDVMPEEA